MHNPEHPGFQHRGSKMRMSSFMFCFFFFSSRRRHTRFDCDWSSDVCSSDLVLLRSRGTISFSSVFLNSATILAFRSTVTVRANMINLLVLIVCEWRVSGGFGGRERGVEGKRGDFGGWRILKKKKKKNKGGRL